MFEMLSELQLYLKLPIYYIVNKLVLKSSIS